MRHSTMREMGLFGCLLAVLAASFVCSQAQASTRIGQSHDPSSSGAVNCSGNRTLIQTGSAGNQYQAPFDGVITSWGSKGWWQSIGLKVARLGSGGSFTVIGSDGPYTQIFDAVNVFPVRIKVRQGDAIGLFLSPGAYFCAPEATGFTYGNTSGNTAAGTTGFFESSVADRALPIFAEIERDADGDGYGDETQDECPTNASTQGPCPLPTVLGQTFTPFSGAQSCTAQTRVITRSPGVVSTAPADGVITSWSHLAQDNVGTGTLRLKIFRPLGGADYRVIGESAPQVPAASTLNTFATRIPVRGGDKIGLRVEGGTVPCSQFTAPGEYGITPADLSVGASATFSINNGALDISAVLEADADGDGYGDTSQDACPSDPATAASCPLVPLGITPNTTPSATPNTKLTKKPRAEVKTNKAKVEVKFKFASVPAGASFQCKLDKGKFRACKSPQTYELKPGRHKVAVRAVQGGLTDPTPAEFAFKVVKR